MDSRSALDWLNQKCSEVAGLRLERLLQRDEIAEGYVTEARCGSAEAALEKFGIGRRHSSQSKTVKSVMSRKDAEPACARARELDGRFHCLGTAVGEHHVSKSGRRQRDECLSQITG